VSPVFQMRKLRDAWQAGLLSEYQLSRRVAAIASLRPGHIAIDEKVILITRFVTRPGI